MRIKYVVSKQAPNKTRFSICPANIPHTDLGAPQKIGEN
jgi:hypothetical protein